MVQASKVFEAGAVSIHAPVKGATQLCRFSMLARAVSIHAPVKGATNAADMAWHCWPSFNPRTREGCDSTPDTNITA